MRRVVAGYGLPEPSADGVVHRVTSPETARASSKPHHAVYRYGERSEVVFDLPLDGDWSDLTATFALRREGNDLVLVLNEIHVF